MWRERSVCIDSLKQKNLKKKKNTKIKTLQKIDSTAKKEKNGK